MASPLIISCGESATHIWPEKKTAIFSQLQVISRYNPGETNNKLSSYYTDEFKRVTNYRVRFGRSLRSAQPVTSAAVIIFLISRTVEALE